MPVILTNMSYMDAQCLFIEYDQIVTYPIPKIQSRVFPVLGASCCTRCINIQEYPAASPHSATSRSCDGHPAATAPTSSGAPLQTFSTKSAARPPLPDPERIKSNDVQM